MEDRRHIDAGAQPTVSSGRSPPSRDFDANGNADLLWRHMQTGDVSAWLMNGTNVKQATVVMPGVPLAWQIR